MDQKFSIKCYFLPLMAAIGYLIIEFTYIKNKLKLWIPDDNYRYIIKAIIIFCWVFIICLLLEHYRCLECFN
jgi:uncharacterized membrane protein